SFPTRRSSDLDPPPHRLGFSLVLREVEHGEARGVFVAQRLEEPERAVAAAVVDEQQLDSRARNGEAPQLADGQTLLFVVAGDDQDQMHGALSTRPPARLRGCSRPPLRRFSTSRTPVAPRARKRALFFAKSSTPQGVRGGTGARAGVNRGRGGWEQPRNRAGGRV